MRRHPPVSCGRWVDGVVTHGVVGDSGDLRLGEQVGVEPVTELCDDHVEFSGAAGWSVFG
jgi:hypothetical protein